MHYDDAYLQAWAWIWMPPSMLLPQRVGFEHMMIPNVVLILMMIILAS